MWHKAAVESAGPAGKDTRPFACGGSANMASLTVAATVTSNHDNSIAALDLARALGPIPIGWSKWSDWASAGLAGQQTDDWYLCSADQAFLALCTISSCAA